MRVFGSHVRMLAGARIATKLRRQFLHAALQQDLPHYDTELTSADVVTGLNDDCAAVQSAISEKVWLCHCTSTCDSHLPSHWICMRRRCADLHRKLQVVCRLVDYMLSERVLLACHFRLAEV